MATTYQQQLAEVNAAITAILEDGQRFVAGGNEHERGRLADLLTERKRLEPLAAAEAAGIRPHRGPRLGRMIPK